MKNESEIDAIMGPLNALIDQAEREGKWLWCAYQDLWFAPEKLRAYNAEGRFRWGVMNWKLRDPKERLAEADRRVSEAQRERDRIAAEIGGGS